MASPEWNIPRGIAIGALVPRNGVPFVAPAALHAEGLAIRRLHYPLYSTRGQTCVYALYSPMPL